MQDFLLPKALEVSAAKINVAARKVCFGSYLLPPGFLRAAPPLQDPESAIPPMKCSLSHTRVHIMV